VTGIQTITARARLWAGRTFGGGKARPCRHFDPPGGDDMTRERRRRREEGRRPNVVAVNPGDPLPPFPGGSADRVALRLVVGAGDADSQLVAMMKWALDVRASGVKCIRAKIGGYEDDPREVWDIPEARRLCQRLVDLGLIAVLEVSALLAEDEKLQRDREAGKDVFVGAGALEVWMLAKGRVKSRVLMVTPEDLDDFEPDLPAAAAACKRVTGVWPSPSPPADRN
jgi:hypothetical protein